MSVADPPVAPGTVQVWSDLLCPFAYVGLLRFSRARTRLGLDDAVRVEHRSFALELFNGPHPRRGTDSEAVGAQSLPAGEALDMALCKAFWTRSRSISHRAVILEVAEETGAVDVAKLAAALDDGRHRADLMADFAVAQTDVIPASPTLRLADGSAHTHPGIEVHWEGPWAAGYPVVDAHDAAVCDDLLRRAAGR